MNDELEKLKKDLETYKSAGEELGNEVLKHKRQNAALRGYNGTLKKQIEALNEKIIEQEILIHQLNEENETLMKEIARLHEELKEEKRPWWKIF